MRKAKKEEVGQKRRRKEDPGGEVLQEETGS